MNTYWLLCALVILTTDDYDTWHQRRVQNLKAEDGWLNLAGLFWLREGSNTFGSDASNDIVFPQNAAKKLGILTLKEGKVHFEKQEGIEVTTVETHTSAPEWIYENGKTTTLQYGTLRWFVIKRGPKYGIRLRDLAHPAFAEFKGIERFAVNPLWKINAKFEKPTHPRTIAITDVLGLISQQPLLGHVVFEVEGQTYRLAATDAGDGRLFLIFKDKTAGHETYGAGRFLYANHPNESGEVILDFNKAINPPCAFSPYATCPLPPAENHLPIRVEAGEKDPRMH
ncbi:MAG: DUF1684 domain-containing protein [Runella sp.]